MNHTLCIIVLFFFFSCNGDPGKKIEAEISQFSTSDASEIFFKNVRQRDYDRMDMKEAKLNIYRIQERNIDSDYPNLFLAIVINWRYDEAYVLVEPNELVPDDLINVKWLGQDSVQGNYSFTYGDKSSHFDFAGQLYSSILSGHDLFMIVGEKEVPFLDKDKDRESFRKTMKDYYRLVDLDRKSVKNYKEPVGLESKK